MTYDDAMARKNDARLCRAEAQLDILLLEVASGENPEEMTAIHELRVASENVRGLLAGTAAVEPVQREETGRAARAELRALEAAVARTRACCAGADGVQVHGLHARLDRAEAELRLWKARRAAEQADFDLRRCELRVALEERDALQRAHNAEQKYDRYNRLAQEALEQAARHFNEAFDAAARRHELRKHHE